MTCVGTETFPFCSNFVQYIFLQNTECLCKGASKTKSAYHKKVFLFSFWIHWAIFFPHSKLCCDQYIGFTYVVSTNVQQ